MEQSGFPSLNCKMDALDHPHTLSNPVAALFTTSDFCYKKS
jgi:hypothetical protein